MVWAAWTWYDRIWEMAQQFGITYKVWGRGEEGRREYPSCSPGFATPSFWADNLPLCCGGGIIARQLEIGVQATYTMPAHIGPPGLISSDFQLHSEGVQGFLAGARTPSLLCLCL